MQVSQIAELDSHVVIGGGKAQAFGMSDSAEFFTVLSDTLYRDKKRAVAREVICNAWDAHIMVGKTDVPVKITLTDTELVIQDFGPGIHDTRIVPIYCVYGASTKVKDDNQTGGFGLGSKAPFAYSDHFTIVSCHDGIKNRYAISRGGVATEGKPEIRKMVSVKTEETGITVTVPLRSKDDIGELQRHIREVVYQGGMLVEFNGSVLDSIDYTEARKTGFGVVQSHSLRESSVYVLYGTVLYPISTTDPEIMGSVQRIKSIMPTECTMILIASPNSLGVTPSREALSYSDKTTATIGKLLDQVNSRIEAKKPSMIKAVVKEIVGEMDLNYIRSDFERMNIRTPNDFTADADVIAHRAVRSRIGKLLDASAAKPLICTAVAQRFRDHRKLYRKLAGIAKDRPTKVSFEHEAFKRDRKHFVRLANSLGLVNELMFLDRLHMAKAQKFKGDGGIMQRLVVAPSMKGAKELIKDSKWMQTVYRDGRWVEPDGSIVASLIIKKPTPALFAKIEAACKRFGIEYWKCDWPERAKPSPPVRMAGFYRLADVDVSKSSGYAKIKDDHTLVATPKFYVKIYGDKFHLTTPQGLKVNMREWLCKRYGDDIAVVNDARQEEKVKKLGARNVYDQVIADLYVLNKARDVQYHYMATGGHFLSDEPYYRSCAEVVGHLSRMDMQLAKFFFPDRVKMTEWVEESEACWRFLNVSESLHIQGADMSAKIAEVRTDRERKARETFKHLMTKSRTLNERYPYLGMLAGLNSIGFKEVDALLDTIRFLKRRHDMKSKLTSSTNDNENMKDAA